MPLRALIAAGLICAVAAGCGDDSTSAEQAQAELGIDLGAPINLADCTDWEEGDVSERLGTIKELTAFLGGPVGNAEGGHGATLDDEQAYDLFERFCANDYARGFKLYKLYTRFAAFGGRLPEN